MKIMIFKDQYGLTQAVLEGRKTMSRRMIPRNLIKDFYEFYSNEYSTEYEEVAFYKAHAFFKVGEVVAVAQRYQDIPNPFLGRVTTYRDVAGWRNKMFVRADLMPHQIRITDIKIERLQDISEEDCLKEGVWIDSHREVLDDNIYTVDVFGKHYRQWHFPSAREAFSFLIDKVSGKGTWESNPWVFAYTFELIK